MLGSLVRSKSVFASEKPIRQRYLWHNRRAVSEIVSSLILLLVVALAGVGLYSFGLSQMNQSQSVFALQTEVEKARVVERFVITAVWLNSSASPSELKVTVLNFGLIDLTIDAAYVDGVAVTAFYGGRGVAVSPKQLLFVCFASPVQIAVGTSHVIRLVTTRGSINEVCWRA